MEEDDRRQRGHRQAGDQHVLQVASFRYRGGKRIFKIAALHHHFEVVGWSEATVVVRFWILCGMFVVAGIAVF